MLYWLKVYGLVGLAVALPIGAIYLIASATRIGIARVPHSGELPGRSRQPLDGKLVLEPQVKPN